jgi:hypothetical protein
MPIDEILNKIQLVKGFKKIKRMIIKFYMKIKLNQIREKN